MTQHLDISAVYKQHAFAVMRRCRQLMRDEAEAEEMMHEVFVRLLEQPGAFRGEARLSTYLFALATHLCLSRLRNTRRRGVDWQAAVREHVSQGDGADDPEMALVQANLVQVILDEPDPVNAAIARYHFLDSLSQGEVAELVGLSRVTVNQRLQRFVLAARRRLQGVA